MGKKELHPNYDQPFNTGANQFIVQLKYRLLGGVRLNQGESKVIKLGERKLNLGQANGLVMRREDDLDKAPVDNWDLIEQDTEVRYEQTPIFEDHTEVLFEEIN